MKVLMLIATLFSGAVYADLIDVDVYDTDGVYVETIQEEDMTGVTTVEIEGATLTVNDTADATITCSKGAECSWFSISVTAPDSIRLTNKLHILLYKKALATLQLTETERDALRGAIIMMYERSTEVFSSGALGEVNTTEGRYVTGFYADAPKGTAYVGSLYTAKSRNFIAADVAKDTQYTLASWSKVYGLETSGSIKWKAYVEVVK